MTLHRQPVGQLHQHSAAPIEAKVTVPAVVGTTILAFTGAVLAALDAFGVPISRDQATAVMALVGATLPLVQLVAGYNAPHTPRPDVVHDDLAH